MNRLLKKSVGIFFVVAVTAVISCNSESELEKTFDVIIDTDLGGDPDDIQPLFRAIHYSDLIKIKGIVSPPRNNLEKHPWDTIKNTELIKHRVKRIDVEQIRANGFPELKPESELLSVDKEVSSTMLDMKETKKSIKELSYD